MGGAASRDREELRQAGVEPGGPARAAEADCPVGVSDRILNDIMEARHLGGYRLYLRYDDGAAGEVDLMPLLQFTGMFEPLRDPAYFTLMRVDMDAGTIVWPNGADLCPDVLRHHLTGEKLPGQEGAAQRTG
jgi:hypothetical protein